MNYFTATIPSTLTEKLKEKGMPLEYKFAIRCLFMSIDKMKPICPTYGKVFDWLMSEKHLNISIAQCYSQEEKQLKGWIPVIDFVIYDCFLTWHEAAEKAIEKALELI